jgi:hypothetical protein
MTHRVAIKRTSFTVTALACRQRQEMAGQPLGDFSELLRAAGE